MLQVFLFAEEALEPLCCHGLASFDPKELEIILKGQLHQTVAIAQLEDLFDRCPKVKAPAEDVLQFGFNNAFVQP